MSAGQKLDMPVPTATVARVRKRSCSDLAVCQGRTPPCTLADGKTPACALIDGDHLARTVLQTYRPGDKPLRLAPGVVEGHKVGLLGSPAQRRELVRYLRHLAAWGAVLIVCGLLVGVMSGVRP